MKILLLASEIAGVISGCSIIFMGIRWTLRWMWRQDEAVADLYDIKQNHLPHIYYALRLICVKLGIDFTEPGGDIGSH